MVGCGDCCGGLRRRLVGNGAGGKGGDLDQQLGPASSRSVDQSLGPARPMDQSLGASSRWMGKLVVRDTVRRSATKNEASKRRISGLNPA
jgi:hypothetical protein